MEFDRENPEKVNSGFSKWIGQTMEKAGRRGIQFTVLVSFTVVSVFIMVLLGFSLYQRFTLRTRAMMTESMEQLMSQTEANFEDYLTSMRRVSDAMYYDTIKDKDMALDSLDSEMSLLYEANKDNLISFALFKRDGSLVCAAPVSTMKEGMDVRLQPWFKMAMERPENLHFSTPHVQNIFNASSFRYYWVISLSRIVELTYSGVPVRGVLLVDMNYNTMLHGIEAISNSPIITLSTFFYSRLSCRMTFEQRKEHIKRNLNALIEETLSATGGVNTHKGFIFAAMCVVVGLGLKAANDTEHYIGPVTPQSLQKAIKEAAAYASAAPASHGTRACKRYKTGGALAMAQSGYEPLFSCWLPLWRQTHDEHRLLLTIMSQLDDTCLLHRGGKKALTWAKQQAREALEDLSPERLARMNEAFVSRGLSPGGSADMFALTRFIDKLV